MAAPRKTVFRVVAEAVNAKLVELLTTEGRQIPKFAFGSTKFEGNEHDARIRWQQSGGSFVEEPKTGATPDPTDAAPAVSPLLVRRAAAHIAIQHANDEDCEHLLESLPRASAQTPFDKYFHWRTSSYVYPSQEVGAELQNGTSVIRLTVLLDIQVNAETDGQFVAREVLSDKLNAGMVDDLADDLDPTDRGASEWAG